MEAILQIDLVNKSYEATKAVNNISLTINKGTIFGLLGPNGAGKTTLIRMITNILQADSGSITLNGESNANQRMFKIGYMPEERGLYKKMKVGEQLLYLAQLKNLSKKEAKERIDFWLKRLEIEDWASKKIEDLSKGMQQKIQFIATIVHEPELIILDEPFSGLDPVNTNLIRDEIYRLREEGATIVFSTHRMEQVEQICEEIALINKGEKILQGSVNNIKQDFKENLFSIKTYNEIPKLETPTFTYKKHNTKEAVVSLNEGFKSNDILKAFAETDAQIESFQEILPSLNEIFIKLVTG